MGQRSQIYVRYSDSEGNKNLIARYYQWNYAERMISRARYSLDWIKEHIPYSWYFTNETNKLIRILDTNFDMVDVVISDDIVKEYTEYVINDEQTPGWKKCKFNKFAFNGQDNNDGVLLIDIKDKLVKYCFLDYNCDKSLIMNASEYMNWDLTGSPFTYGWESDYPKYIVKDCESNIEEIDKLATRMTREEVDNFLNDDYSYLFTKKD